MTNPLYYRATYIACTLAIFQILTGINVVLQQIPDIFDKNDRFVGVKITGFNLFFSLFSTVLLYKFGRKQLMVYGQLAICVTVILMGVMLL